MLTKMGHFASSKNIVCNFISSLPCLTHKKTFTFCLRFYRTFMCLFKFSINLFIRYELEDAKNSIYHSKTNILQKWLKYTRYGI